jgi:hypothetical protein
LRKRDLPVARPVVGIEDAGGPASSTTTQES